jgi:hypothetical protein
MIPQTLFAILQVPVAPIDVTSVVAVIMGILVILIPISGLTARFALKPIAEAVARMREAQGASQALGLVEQRLALLEQQMSNLESDMKRIEDVTEFDRQLRSGSQETEEA